MNQLPYDPQRPLSLWTVNSETDTDVQPTQDAKLLEFEGENGHANQQQYASGLREAETVSEPLVVPDSTFLNDPPLQWGEALNDRAVQLRRLAPSTESENQQVNTVEIVKKDGNYSVVLDGVSQGVINAHNGEVDYWLPRFKETMASENGNKGKPVRTTQPVVFSMRLEDYEGVPESCNVHVLQSVVNCGTIVMDNKEIKKVTITPYSTGSVASEVAVLPYPLISTPEPHFYINDYVRMRNTEIEIMALDGKSFSQVIWNFFNKREQTPLDYAHAWRDLVKGIWNSLPNPTGFGKVGLFMILDTLDYMKTPLRDPRSWLPILPLTEEAQAVLTRLLKIHERECTKKPTQYRVGISELSKILRRVSGPSGSLHTGTAGMSIEGLNDIKWHKEAALMHWLQYGEGGRFHGGGNMAPDKTTGLYSPKQNLDHNNNIETRARTNTEVPITGNTINNLGMDPYVLSDTRTQFSFMIKIVESDGSTGPTITLRATRMNGIDAGWVSAGYEDTINVIREEVDNIESNLMGMQSVTQFLGEHSTLVAGSDNGYTADDNVRGDSTLKAPTQLEGQKLYERQQGDLVELEEATDKFELSKAALIEANRVVERIKLDQCEVDDKYNGKVRKINGYFDLRDTGSDVDRQRKLDNARQERDKYQARLTRLLKEAENTALKKGDLRLKASRAKERWEAFQGRASDTKKYNNVIDYEKILKRLRFGLLGGDNDTTTNSLDWWQGLTLERPGGEFEAHRKHCREYLNMSMGARPGEIEDGHFMHVRFIRIFSNYKGVDPEYDNKSNAARRFASFIVPRADTWIHKVASDNDRIVRMLPQIVTFSTSNVSIFGKVKILQPLFLANSELVEEQTDGKNSVHVMDMTLGRLSKLYDVPGMIIWNNTCHMIQVYKKNAAWGACHREVFLSTLDTTRSSADLMAMSALPTKTVMKHTHIAVSAGGDNMKRHNYVTAGCEPFNSNRSTQTVRHAQSYLLTLCSRCVLHRFVPLLRAGTMYTAPVSSYRNLDANEDMVVYSPSPRSRRSSLFTCFTCGPGFNITSLSTTSSLSRDMSHRSCPGSSPPTTRAR